MDPGQLIFLGRRSLNNNLQNTFFGGTVNFFEGTAAATVPTTFLSPSPSPDEMIIRQRGRRRIPVIFSPDIDDLKRVCVFFSSVFYSLLKS